MSYERLGERMAVEVRKLVADAKAEMRKEFADRMAAMVERVDRAHEELRAARKSTPATLYKGVWQRAASYAPDEMITHGGSLWVALRECRGVEPGPDPSAWQLASKGGKPPREDAQ